MGFQIPWYLQSYLDKKGESPFQNFVNTSQYYAETNAYLMTYLNRVVRQCVAYGCGTHDGAYNGGISTNIGYTAIKSAVKLIKGDRILFAGDDMATDFLSDIWMPHSRFDIFIDELITYTLQGGTSLFKINKDAMGRCTLSASRVDRNTFTVSDSGNIIEATFMLSLLSSTKSTSVNEELWLVERRFYKNGKPTVVYNVHRKSGVAANETLPLMSSEGLPYDALSDNAKEIVKRLGIKLNRPALLPFRDGLGVWVALNTATNSCVPGLKMGDPALYGTLDILWAIDTVFSGSIIDVLNGEGKVLVPKRFLGNINEAIKRAVKNNPEWGALDVCEERNDGFVYVSVPHDKDFPPTSIQFDIRSTEYRDMYEMYLKQFAVAFGYAPTTLFPYLQDNSPKTATEVTAEENLTRASVQSAHRLLLPELNRAIAEVLYQHGFHGSATLQLSDYIGNKLMRDDNLRQNYASGLIPHSTAVQIINGLSAKETDEYLEKIDADEKKKSERESFGQFPFDEKNYFGEVNDESGTGQP